MGTLWFQQLAEYYERYQVKEERVDRQWARMGEKGTDNAERQTDCRTGSYNEAKRL